MANLAKCENNCFVLCVEKDSYCPDVGIKPHTGSFLGSRKIDEKSTIMCNEGYELSDRPGENFYNIDVTCKSRTWDEGVWDPVPPMCIRAYSFCCWAEVLQVCFVYMTRLILEQTVSTPHSVATKRTSDASSQIQ